MTVRINAIATTIAALVLGLACDIDIDVNDTGGDDADSANDEGMEEDDGLLESGEDGSEETGLAESGEESGEEGSEESGGGAADCDPLAQDCPEAEACYIIDGGGACAPDASGDDGGPLDPCDFVNACDPGLQCVDAAAVPGCLGDAGCCTPFCDVDGADACPFGSCTPVFEPGEAPPGLESTGVCSGEDTGGGAECDPLSQDCPAGDACYVMQEGTACVVDASGEQGAELDVCEFVNVCDPGLQCVAADAVPGCAGGACCTPFCDINGAGEECSFGTCNPIFEPGEAPPGLESTGVCTSE